MRTPHILIIVLSLIIVISNSCDKSPDVISRGKAPVQDSALIFGDPFDYGIAGMLIFPVGSNYQPDLYEKTEVNNHHAFDDKIVLSFTDNDVDNDRFADTEYANVNEDEFDIRNIIFYNLESGKSYPLLSDTLHILSFALHKDFTTPLILYRMVKNDVNGDSLYNSSDAVLLFVSDLYGHNLTQVSPDEEKFIDYFYYPATGTILLKTILDMNHDKIFSASEETDFREVKLNAPAMGREIFNAALKDSLRI